MGQVKVYVLVNKTNGHLGLAFFDRNKAYELAKEWIERDTELRQKNLVFAKKNPEHPIPIYRDDNDNWWVEEIEVTGEPG